jgi:hypothetical protein
MFLSQDLEISGLDNDFFKRFAPADDGTPKLAKIIRGNGRLSLFRKLNPNAKIILIVRNPIDMVNSVKYKFAFFGDDFYPSDFPRFCHELTVLGRLGIDPGSATWAEQQAEYVIQMTRAAMEFASRDPNTLILEYDRFIADLPHTLQTLLTFLDLSFKDTYLAALKTPVGATTASSVLSEMEFGKIIKYAEAYDGLCRQAGLEQGKSIKDLVDIYKDRYQAGDYDSRLDGLVTNPLRRIVWRLEGRIHQLESKLVSIQASRNWS